MKRINKRLGIPIVAACVLYGAGAAHADAVTDWNAIMQATVAVPPTNPIFQTRWGAIVQLAVFEAVNAITGDYEPYLGTIAAPPWASPDAAAIAAAHRTLVALRPGSAAALDALRAESLAAIPDGPAKEAGIAVGEARRGRHARCSGPTMARDAPVPYTPGTDPGDWQPTPPASQPALLPGWGQVTPFGLEEGSQFRLPPPPALHTGKYANDYNEVKLARPDRQPLPAAGPHRRRALLRRHLPGAGVELGRAPGQRRAGQDALGERAGSSPCWRWPWAMPRSRCAIPSTTTTSGGP